MFKKKDKTKLQVPYNGQTVEGLALASQFL